MRYYRIICLKRSVFAERSQYEYLSDWLQASKIIYWKPDYQGYTHFLDDAGVYSVDMLYKVGGQYGDWFLEPVRYGYEP